MNVRFRTIPLSAFVATTAIAFVLALAGAVLSGCVCSPVPDNDDTSKPADGGTAGECECVCDETTGATPSGTPPETGGTGEAPAPK